RRVGLDVEQLRYVDRSHRADRVEVVAEQVHDHQVLGAVLGVVAQLLYQGTILGGVGAPGPSALDRLGLDVPVQVDREASFRGCAEHGDVDEVEKGPERDGAYPAKVGEGGQHIDLRVDGDHIGHADLVGLTGVDLVEALVDPLEIGGPVVPELDIHPDVGIGHGRA